MDRRGIVSRLLLMVPLLAAELALGAPSPAAAAFSCTTDIIGGTIKECVVVPAGATCKLFGGVTVRGGVTVEPGAHFQTDNGIEIRGPVTATSPWVFIISGSVVRGGVTVTGDPDMLSLTVQDSQVRGDIVLTGNVPVGSFDIIVVRTAVRGSVVLRNNSAIGGRIVVGANAIEVNLDCSGNTPNPIPGGNSPTNTVGGVATGQCAGLIAP